MSIQEIVQQDEPSIEQLIDCFEMVKENGDMAFIKFDGMREHTHYTVMITFPANKREMIRADKNSLRLALIEVLTAYVA